MARAPAAVLEDPNAAPTTGYAAPLMPGGLFTLPPTRPCANVAYQVGKQLSMSDHVKISSAFDAFVADSSPNEECDALVIFRAPRDGSLPWRSKNPSDRTHVTARAERERTLYVSVTDASHLDELRRLFKRVELTPSFVGSKLLRAAQVEVTLAKLPELAEHPEVVAIVPNQKLHPIEPRVVDHRAASPDESKAGLTWGLNELGIPELWKRTKGEQINVAVLDTGVHGDHPCISGRVREFVVIDPLGRRIEASPSFDSGQHGTHVCGTIAGGKTKNGISIGVAPQANLLVAGVLLGNATLRTLIEGMSWAIENGAHIINMSLGFTYYEPMFVEVFNALIHDHDILPIVAIGNDNHGNSSSPGNASNALSVGAVREATRGKTDVASFSSGASLVFPGQDDSPVIKPDVVAPGVRVYSCIPPDKPQGEGFEYSYMDGTSMASPHVAGVAALLMAAHPSATVSEIATALKQTARHPGGDHNRPDNRWGYGIIQPQDALSALSS